MPVPENINSIIGKINFPKLLKLSDGLMNNGINKISIFPGDIKITGDIKNILKNFDQNGDKTIDEKEFSVFMNRLLSAAREDKTLDKDELLGIFGLTKSSKNADKIVKEFNTLVERLVNGESVSIEKNGNVETTKKFKLDGSGTRVDKTYQNSVVVKKETYVYSEGGNLKQKTVRDANSTTTIAYKYDQNGNISSQHIVKKDNNNNVVEDYTLKHYYNEDNKRTKTVKTFSDDYGNHTHTTTFDINTGLATSKTKVLKDSSGKVISSSQTEYAQDGKTTKKHITSYYKRGALIKDVYDGNNLDNRIKGSIPTQRIVYEQDGKTVKYKIVNKFNAKGILIGSVKYDKDGKVIENQDFSKIGNNFGVAYQVTRGDCYLLATINSLEATDKGQTLLKQNIKMNKDGSGKITSYTVMLPGAKLARESLINGTGNVRMNKLPSDKVFIQESYTISAAEFESAMLRAGLDYSYGDKNVLLMEIAYEKYRNDVARTLSENNLSRQAYTAGLQIGSNNLNGDEFLNGGNSAEAMFILTGKKSDHWKQDYDNAPVCIIGNDMNMWLETRDKAISVIDNNIENFDDMINRLIEDSSDGKLDKYCACVSIKVHSQQIGNNEVRGSGHAFSVSRVTSNNVYLKNPWDPTREIVMPMADFCKAVYNIYCTKI